MRWLGYSSRAAISEVFNFVASFAKYSRWDLWIDPYSRYALEICAANGHSGQRPAWLSLLARIVLWSNPPAMPRQQGVWGHDAGQAQKVFATDGLAFHGQSAVLVIIEARAFSQLLFEHADFLLEVFDDDLWVAVHPSGTANQEQREGIHEAIIPSADPGDQQFVAGRPLRFGRKDSHSKSLNIVRVFGQYVEETPYAKESE